MNVFFNLGQAVRAAGTFRRYALAWSLGMVSALSLPPFFLIILLVPAFTGLLLMVSSSRTKRSAFLVGWWFGAGYFLAGLYWIAIALLVDPDQFAWLIPFATFGIAGVLAVYIGLVTLITYLIPVSGWGKVTAFTAFWVISEWLRAHLFTGFPWNLIGYSWSFSGSMIQLAAVTGIYGLSVLAVLVAAMPYVLLEKKSVTKAAWVPMVLALLLVLGVGAGGFWRLQAAPVSEASGPRIRIVQANIPQNIKWVPERMYDALEQHMMLSRHLSTEPLQMIIWPESAIPYYLNQEPEIRAAISRIIPKEGFLITGSLRLEQGAQSDHVWNSLYVIDHEGGIADIYDKVHLVPFGEYIPLRALITLNKITAGTSDFSTGSGIKTLSAQGRMAPYSPLICYEAIFPDNVIHRTQRPAWMVNITNDAWFGISTGPYQHLYAVRLRAVEQGIPLVRAANTGISAIIDSYGRINALLGLGEKGVLDGTLPPPVAQTFYGRYGDMTIAILVTLLIMVTMGKEVTYRKA